ncbi:hypothetical protein P8C59_004482 [Phyllachora maydis]|uniref:Uncharacterized protein n=1 Tax=Phyllachora maydis TaxID=1825666 RepID=A0AAD9I3R6_9PEZI|nr:hypothetical protein P8C59_004482 [Phyllachora maydis]
MRLKSTLRSSALTAAALLVLATASPVFYPCCEEHPPPTAFMTVDECKSHLDTRYKDRVLFWSGVLHAAEAMLKDQDGFPYLDHHKLMRHIFLPADFFQEYMARFRSGLETAANVKFWDACSQAVAEVAEGTIYVVLPDGRGLDWGTRAHGHWARLEFPVLCAKHTVTRMYRLSADDPLYKEDLTDKVMRLRNAGRCPPLGGFERYPD